MPVRIESLKLPKASELNIDIRLSSVVNVTAFAARQKVTGYVADEISTHTHGGEPVLSVGQHIRWRVPVILSLPPYGDLGEVGHIEVDMGTGQLMVTSALLEEIRYRAQELAVRTAPATA